MARLNFSTIVELTPNVDSASIANIPDDTVQQIYTQKKLAYIKSAKLTSSKDYAHLSFGAAKQLPYTNVTFSCIKNFPQEGNYGFVTMFEGTSYSRLFRNIS